MRVPTCTQLLSVWCRVMRQSDCPITSALRVIAGKWKPLIFRELQSRSVRHGELKRRIPEASQRMLTLQLRQLERDGLVTRSVHHESVLRTQYELTPYGKTLLPALEALSRWGRAHRTRLRRT
jgi:DNA-binding HxlR family transcriptional regulator